MNRETRFAWRRLMACRRGRAAGAAVLALYWLAGCGRDESGVYQGYVEGEYVHVAAAVPGQLVRRQVERGDEVTEGQTLFVLESGAEEAALAEVGKRAELAAARLENLRKGLRPTEVAALEARLAKSEASLEWWTSELRRREELFRKSVISESELDQTRAQAAGARGARDADASDLATARLGGREDEVRAAEAEWAAWEAARARARWALDQKTQSAPVAARVDDVLFQPGEYVAAGQPVVTLLPPANLKVRFFVPAVRVGDFAVGREVRIRVDGSDAVVTGRVLSVAAEPEFTPPVIFSRTARAKLVYRVEATCPGGAERPGFAPGQPVDVEAVAGGNP